MDEPIRTLVVDDEAGIRFTLEKTLSRVGHNVTVVGSGEDALEVLRDTPFDLAFLDLNLGGHVDGLRILEAARWRWPNMAVIILTAHGSLDSAMEAIREGVDRYVLKPVTPKELREVVEEVLSQKHEEVERIQDQTEDPVLLRRGDFVVDLQKHCVSHDKEILDLTAREYDLLVHMMENSYRVISPKELVEVVRGYRPDHIYEARNIIKWYIHRLRQSIEPDPSHPVHIVNVRGVGYRFVA